MQDERLEDWDAQRLWREGEQRQEHLDCTLIRYGEGAVHVYLPQSEDAGRRALRHPLGHGRGVVDGAKARQAEMPVALAPLVRVAINLSYAGLAHPFGKPEAAALSPQG